MASGWKQADSLALKSSRRESRLRTWGFFLRWYKAPGFLSQIWERSVRLLVDRTRLEEARAIADRVLSGQPDGDGSSSGQT